MENRLLIQMHDPVVKFCVSFITLNVAEVGLQRFIASWNSHPLEGNLTAVDICYKLFSLLVV